MAIKRFQNKVAESRFALPATALLSLPVWAAAAMGGGQVWQQFVLTVVTAYIMVELNNANLLIRTYSRMVSCSFLALSALFCARYATPAGSAVQFCFAAFYLLLFRGYQSKQAPGTVFFAFLALGVAGTLFVQTLYLVPVLWAMMLTKLMMMSARNFTASLLGLVCPYWFYSLYLLYYGHFATLGEHFTGLWTFAPMWSLDRIDSHLVFSTLLLAGAAVTGAVHFVRTSYNDKIRTRMIYEVFITIDTACLIMLVLLPEHYNELTAIAIVNTAPLIGHYIALTRTFITDLSVKLMLVALAATIIYNTWIQHSIF